MRMPKFAAKLFKDEGYRIFAIAILASLAWHFVWLSTIVIVPGPGGVMQVKFSKVSFLGPLLGGGAMELAASPRERSFLEKRYIDAANKIPSDLKITPAVLSDKGVEELRTRYVRDRQMEGLVEEALGEKKTEPSYLG